MAADPWSEALSDPLGDAVEAWLAEQPYSAPDRRPGRRGNLLLTAEQWADYGRWYEKQAELHRRYGHLPSAAVVNELAGEIW